MFYNLLIALPTLASNEPGRETESNSSTLFSSNNKNQFTKIMEFMEYGQDLYFDKMSVDLVNYYVSGFNTPPEYNRPEVEGWSRKRLLSDLKELECDAPTGIEGNAIEDDIHFWNISFLAPNKKLVEAILHFPDNYPFSPPTMYIKKRLFHPNITTEGKVCLEELKNMWTPAHTIWSLILTVQCLVEDPNPYNPVNSVAAKMFLLNPEIYHNIAWQCFEMLDSCNAKDGGLVGEDLKEAELENSSHTALSAETIVQLWSLQSALEGSFSS